MRKAPPKKRAGQGKGPRRINGASMDVDSGAAFLGWTPKRLRNQASRGLVPYRREGGRIIFLRAELEAYLARLPGVTLEEALANVGTRGA